MPATCPPASRAATRTCSATNRSLWDTLAQALGVGEVTLLTIASDVRSAVEGTDFLYTDVGLSMGEPEEEWGET